MKSALLVIDVQRALFNADEPPFEAKAVVERINSLSARANSAGVPIFIIQHEANAGPLLRESSGWQLADGLQTRHTDIFIGKRTPDSFLNTGLHQKLQALDVQRVILCGYASEFCVDTTCRSAAAHGYSVCIASDAHTTHDKPHATGSSIRIHENSTLPNITSFGVPIVAVGSADIKFAA